jgi:hypothetical protein
VPLPQDVPGVANIAIKEKGTTFLGYPVTVLGAHVFTDQKNYRVYFDDFREGVLYASLIGPVD